MPEMPNADELIATALQLPLAQRVALANAMLTSLDTSTDADMAELDLAWKSEIGRRIDEIDSGRVKTVPSSDMWQRIGGKPRGRT